MNRYATVTESFREAERMRHFHALGQRQQAEAIRRLAATGMTEHGIARATALSVEMIRRVMAEHGVRRA